MAIKTYSAYLQAPAFLEPHHQMLFNVMSRTLVGRVLPLCKNAVGLFNSHSRPGWQWHGSNLDFPRTNFIKDKRCKCVTWWPRNYIGIVGCGLIKYDVIEVSEIIWSVKNVYLSGKWTGITITSNIICADGRYFVTHSKRRRKDKRPHDLLWRKQCLKWKQTRTKTNNNNNDNDNKARIDKTQ